MKQLAWIVTFSTLGAAAAASAQATPELCPGTTSAVTMTPRWWDIPGHPSDWATSPRRDPGWTGAAQAAFGGGLGTRGIFRAVYGSDSNINPGTTDSPVLFLSWQMDMSWLGLDACLNPNARIYFAVKSAADPDMTHAKVYRLELRNRADVIGPGGTGLTCDSRSLAASSGTSLCHEPTPTCTLASDAGPGTNVPGMASFAIYTGSAAGGFTVSAGATGDASYLADYGHIWIEPTGPWTVNLAIPVGTGSGIQGDDLKVYFEVRNCRDASCITEQWPRRDPGETHAITQPFLFANLTAPPLDQWGSMRLPPAAAGTPCNNGVILDEDDIGLVADPPISSALADPSNPASYTFDFFGAKLQTEIVGLSGGTPARNVFVARPTNATGAIIASDKLTARFRLADWGSVADIGTGGGWIDIPGEPEPPPPANEIKNYSDIPIGNNGVIVYQWKLTAAERCTYGLETTPPDGGPPCGSKLKDNQVLLVQLKGHAGSNLDFVNDSTYRSMRFVNASRFTDQAAISVEGLPPATGDRTIYIAVRQSQMSIAQGEPRVPSIDAYMRLDDYLQQFENLPGTLGGPALERLTSIRDRLHNELDGSPEILRGQPERQKALYETLRNAPTFALRKILPTVDYEVFRESDIEVADGDEHFKILEPMSSFGYFVQHLTSTDQIDEVFGWVHTLKGPIERIGPALYKLKIPAGQTTAVIETRIQALEKATETPDVDEPTGGTTPGDCGTCPTCPPCPTEPPCVWWKWLLAILLAVAIAIAIGIKIGRRN